MRKKKAFKKIFKKNSIPSSRSSKGYYSTVLNELYRPKTEAQLTKVKELEKLMVEYVLVRYMEDLEESDIKDIESADFESLSDLTEYMYQQKPSFRNVLDQYITEFLERHGRIK